MTAVGNLEDISDRFNVHGMCVELYLHSRNTPACCGY